MYMEPFETKRKYYTVQEGEILRDSGERGEWLYFKVTAIDENSVILQDPGGETFQVGLYDHQRQQRKSLSRDTSGIQISVGGEEMKMQAAGGQKQGAERQKTGSQAQENQSQTSTGQNQANANNATNAQAGAADTGTGSGEGPEEGDAEAQQAQPTGPQSLIDALKNLRNRGNNNDQGATPQPRTGQESGGGENMRKIETPFGTIYRPAN
jgi:hypothetical protein